MFLFCQLLYPLGENSPIAGFLKKKADGGIHHICIEVRQFNGFVIYVDVVIAGSADFV